MKLYSAYYGSYYPFKEMGFFNAFAKATNPDDLKERGTLVVWGGGDISPTLYNKPVSRFTGADERLSVRDKVEWDLMVRAKEMGMPILGVCRGAQMLCALAGGTLIQHVDNHAGADHPVVANGETFEVCSLHHQMMNPGKVDHELIAWTKPLSRRHIDVTEDIPLDVEPEMIFFPQLKGVGVQWHPEMMREDDRANTFLREFLAERVYGN